MGWCFALLCIKLSRNLMHGHSTRGCARTGVRCIEIIYCCVVDFAC